MDKKHLDYRLCYVDEVNDFGTQYSLYFTDDFDNAWGDDWNDRPANCNAEPPYEDRGDLFMIIMTCNYNGFLFGGMTYSAEDMNNHVAAWLVSNNKEKSYTINGGDTFLDVINKIKEDKDIDLYIKIKGEDV